MKNACLLLLAFLFIAVVSKAQKVDTDYSNKGDAERSKIRSHRKHASSRLWYFGVEGYLGVSNASFSDPGYTTSSGNYSSINLFAVKMFSRHLGFQFGLGGESYAYNVNFNGSTNSRVVSDVFTLNRLNMPLRVLYFRNSKHRAVLYVTVGFDISYNWGANDKEGGYLDGYYKPVFISPYLGAGIQFRNRYSSWMLGPYCKTSLLNIYPNWDVYTSNFVFPPNRGTLYCVGLSLTYMGKISR